MSFGFYRTVTIDHTKVPNTDQTNFPVLISFTDASFKTVANGGHTQNANGYDIQFFSNSLLTTPLNFELGRFVPTTGEYLAWVNVPSLSHTVDTVIYIGYGDVTLTVNPSSTATWETNFKDVNHLGDGSSLSLTDSTSNGNNFTNHSVTAVAGQISGGGHFSDTSGYLSLASNGTINNPSALTLSAWVKPAVTSLTDKGIITKWNGTTGYMLYMSSGNVRGYINAVFATSAAALASGTWAYVSMVWSGTSIQVYINGVASGSSAAQSTFTSSADEVEIGLYNVRDGVSNFNGDIDETRIAFTARSADWLLTEYNNQNSPGSFFTLGVETVFGIIIPPAAFLAVRVDMALGGSYRQKVWSNTPKAWYRFAEQLGSTVARDISSNAFHATASGSVTFEEAPTVPEGGFSVKFTGGKFTASLPAFGTTMTFEAVVKPNTPGTAGVFLSNAADTVYIGYNSSRFPTVFFGAADHLASAAIPNLAWTHLMIIINAGSGTFYINGVASGTFTSFPGFTPTTIGINPSGTNKPLACWLDELVLYTTALSSAQPATNYLSTLWTDISTDLNAVSGLSTKFGINGNGPKDRLPDVSPMTFTLKNHGGNSAGLQGYYSPLHANCRSGFTRGVLTRCVFTYGGIDYPRFMGKIGSIDPLPGRYASQLTSVMVNDLVNDLVDADLRNVTTQINQTEAQLLLTLIEALPVTAQPLAMRFDTGLDTSPFAFDNLGAGIKAITPAADIVMSSIGYLSVGPTGVLRYENRQARQLAVSTYSYNDNMIGLTLPTTIEGVFNHFRVTYHQKNVDTSATTVLYSIPVASTAQPSSTSIAPGATIEIWGDYFNPANVQQNIGGTAQVAPVVTTDYLANSLADNSGTNKSANITVVATPFASTVKFSITNNDAALVYVTKLQIRGKGLYDNSPITIEVMSTQPYGDQPESIDMPYQSDFNTAKALADYLLSQFQALGSQVVSIKFLANTDNTLMLSALSTQVGGRITITETQTGLTAVDAFIQAVQLDLSEGPWLTCTLFLSVLSYFSSVWIMDDPVFSLADTTTIFAFA